MDKYNEGESTSAPTTPGQAEGSENIDQQSQSTPAPQQTDQAEGEDKNDDKGS